MIKYCLETIGMSAGICAMLGGSLSSVAFITTYFAKLIERKFIKV